MTPSMWKAIVWKELRDLLPFVVLAIVCQTYIVAAAMGMGLPFVRQDGHQLLPFDPGSDAIVNTTWVALGFALLIGLWQTWFESLRGGLLYLLHRPPGRVWFWGAKLAIGTVLCLAAAVLPVLFYALWCATPGKHAGPFFWSSTLWAWQWSLWVPLVYCGAFLTGLRPARLFGTRLFPLAGALVLVTLLIALPTEHPAIITLGGMALAGAVAWVVYYVAATRDYA